MATKKKKPIHKSSRARVPGLVGNYDLETVKAQNRIGKIIFDYADATGLSKRNRLPGGWGGA